jgi:hypothetical protein
VYEWHAWTDFLITRIVPAATRITASVLGGAAKVLAAVPPTAGVFLFHVDCTFSNRFPRDRANLIAGLDRRGITVWNGQVTDISKRHLQAVCVRAGMNTTATTASGDPREMVMIKTNLNSAGVRERYLTWWQRWRLGIELNGMICGREDYRVMRRSEVPASWWLDETLVVERYISNAENVWFRASVFLDHLVISRARFAEPVKRMYQGSERTNSRFLIRDGAAAQTHDDVAIPATVVNAIVPLLSQTALDFGTLDVACDDDGNAFVVDLNVTPFCRDGSDDIITHLRGAMNDRRSQYKRDA